MAPTAIFFALSSVVSEGLTAKTAGLNIWDLTAVFTGKISAEEKQSGFVPRDGLHDAHEECPADEHGMIDDAPWWFAGDGMGAL